MWWYENSGISMGNVGGKHSVIFNCYTYTCFLKSKSYVDTRCFTANTPHCPFAVGKTMETFH